MPHASIMAGALAAAAPRGPLFVNTGGLMSYHRFHDLRLPKNKSSPRGQQPVIRRIEIGAGGRPVYVVAQWKGGILVKRPDQLRLARKM
jgi:hypothetical protein